MDDWRKDEGADGQKVLGISICGDSKKKEQV